MNDGEIKSRKPEREIPKLEQLRELVEMREKMGKFFLELVKIQRLAHEPRDVAGCNLLLGIGFSLWRAAFLIDEDRKANDVREHALVFLDTLLLDNAIGYPQDRKAKAWTSGYYVNNAAFRGIELGEYYGLSNSEPFSLLPPFVRDGTLKESGPPKLVPGWHLCYEAARAGLKAVIANSHATSRQFFEFDEEKVSE